MTDTKTIIKNWCAACGMPEPSDGECHALEVAFAAPVAAQQDYPGDTVADRLDAMADDQPSGSQAHSDLLAAATVWRKHVAGQAAQAPQIDLHKFYGVETDGDLITAQQRHIEKLQARMAAAPSLAPQRPREG